MSIYTPYFYVIQDVRNGMYYAGSKYGKDANPDNFMIKGGYTTSSNLIKNIIEEQGFNSFIIRKLKKFEIGQEAYDYETRFLQKVNAANHKKFYNSHNNMGWFDPDVRKKRMVEKYGKEHPAQVPEILQRILSSTKKTLMTNYGVKHNFLIPSVKEKIIKDNLEKYGVEHFSQTEQWKNKTSNTYIEKYGVEWITQSPKIKDKIKKTSVEKYGETHYTKTDECKKRLRISSKNQFEDKEKRETHRQACINKNSARGKIWINDGKKNKRVFLEIFKSEYAERGWVIGRLLGKNPFWDYDKSGENNPFHGKKHSDETKKKISKTKLEKENI